MDHPHGTATPRCGIKLTTLYVSIGEALRLARRVDSLGYDAVWREGGADRTRCGHCHRGNGRPKRTGPARHVRAQSVQPEPALLAITAAAIDQISRGRYHVTRFAATTKASRLADLL